jgi:hypothetical protein
VSIHHDYNPTTARGLLRRDYGTPRLSNSAPEKQPSGASADSGRRQRRRSTGLISFLDQSDPYVMTELEDDVSADREDDNPGGDDDPAENDLDDEPSLGSLDHHHSQAGWAAGGRRDLEQDHAETSCVSRRPSIFAGMALTILAWSSGPTLSGNAFAGLFVLSRSSTRPRNHWLPPMRNVPVSCDRCHDKNEEKDTNECREQKAVVHNQHSKTIITGRQLRRVKPCGETATRSAVRTSVTDQTSMPNVICHGLAEE